MVMYGLDDKRVKNMNFIKTSDEKLAEKLRSFGYKELKAQGKFFVFVNNSAKYTFNADEEKKIIRTNKMEV